MSEILFYPLAPTLGENPTLARLCETRERMRGKITRLMAEKRVPCLPSHWRRRALRLVLALCVAVGSTVLQSPAEAQAPILFPEPPKSEPPPSGSIWENFSPLGGTPVPDEGPSPERIIPWRKIASGPVTVYAPGRWEQVIETRIRGRDGKPALNPRLAKDSTVMALINMGYCVAVSPEQISEEYREAFKAFVSSPDFKRKSDEEKIEALRRDRVLSGIANREVIGQVIWLVYKDKNAKTITIPAVVMDTLSAEHLAALKGIVELPPTERRPFSRFTVDVSLEILKLLGVGFEPGIGFVDRKTGKPVSAPVVDILVYGN